MFTVKLRKSSLLVSCAALTVGHAIACLTPNTPVFAQGGEDTMLEQVLCTDPRGCPDLIVDERRLNEWLVSAESFAPEDCSVVEGFTVPGDRLLLRFSFNMQNLGPGDLIIGDPFAGPHADLFEDSLCHGHRHFKKFSDYRLWTEPGYLAWLELSANSPDALPVDLLSDPGNQDIAAQLVAGTKLAICAVDTNV